MAKLKKDVEIDSAAFDTAIHDFNELETSANDLITEFNTLFDNFAKALQCETGDELKLAGQDVVIEPINNLIIVIGQVRNTLIGLIGSDETQDEGTNQCVGEEHYKKIFDEFNELKDNIT